MANDDPSKDLCKQEAERLMPVILAFHKRANILRLADFVGAIIPAAAVIGLAGNVLPVGEALLATGVCAAGIVQTARWHKQSLKQAFDKIWENAEQTTRPLLLGHLKETFVLKVGKSPNVISHEDFNLHDRSAAATLLGTAIVGLTYPPVGPIMFFTGLQAREYGDSMKIENAARRTVEFYNYILRSPA